MPPKRPQRPFQPRFEPIERRDVPTIGLATHAAAVATPAHHAHVSAAVATPAHRTHIVAAVAPAVHQAHVISAAAPAVHQAHVATAVASPNHQAHVDTAITIVDPFESLAIRDQADLHPGNILVTTGEGRVSKAIRDVTLSEYSHAALYVGGGKIIDATGEGVRERSLPALTLPSTRVGIIRADGLTEAQTDRVVGTAHKLVGKPYNYLGLIVGAVKELHLIVRLYRLATGEPFKATGSVLGLGYFCSELVIKAFHTAGVTIAPESGDTPQGIISYATGHPTRFELVGRLPAGRA